MDYLKRTADEFLCLQLASSGAALIESPKWCGKTTTAEQQANSIIRLQDPDMRDKYQATIDGINRSEKVASAILQSYARNISTLAKKNVVFKDVNKHLEGVNSTSFDAYLDALQRLFVIQNVEAWSPAIRSASAIRRGSKREFVDPSIAVAALGLSPEALYTDLKTFGFLFECMAIRDLKAYSLSLGGSISYYHDRYDLEADAVLHLENGHYALIEFKLGSREIEEGAEHLKEIKRLVQEHNKTEKQIKLREPDLMTVITGGEMAYTRPDGVKIIPFACLKD